MSLGETLIVVGYLITTPMIFYIGFLLGRYSIYKLIERDI